MRGISSVCNCSGWPVKSGGKILSCQPGQDSDFQVLVLFRTFGMYILSDAATLRTDGGAHSQGGAPGGNAALYIGGMHATT